MNKEQRFDKAYIKMAEALSTLSYAERAKVGCLIVNECGQIVSQGYNGTPGGFDNCCETVERVLNKEDTELYGHNILEDKFVTKKDVLHAESNAISKCAKWGGSTNNATLYVTLSPCYECAKLIIQAGIRRVVYKDEYRDTEILPVLIY